MAWTTPKTWVAAEVLLAADMNTYVSDNLDYLKNEVENVDVSNASSLTTGTLDADIFPSGFPLQVVQAVKKDAAKTASIPQGGVSSATDPAVSDLTATLTPSRGDSKVLVQANISVSANDVDSIYLYLFRKIGSGGTWEPVSLAIGSEEGSRVRVTASTRGGNVIQTVAFSYLDSLSAATAPFYTVCFGHSAGGGRDIAINRSDDNDSNSNRVARAISTITLTEIRG